MRQPNKKLIPEKLFHLVQYSIYLVYYTVAVYKVAVERWEASDRK